MKRKLLFAMLCIVGALNASAQEDVTATYLKNADFSSGTAIDNSVCTYGKDMETNSTTYYGAQAIDEWTIASVGTTDEGFDGCGVASAVFAYGGTPWLGGTGFTAPVAGPAGNAGNAAGLISVWGNTVQYTQDVTLPAGSYTVRFQVYNATNASGSSAQTITSNLFGFVDNNGTTYYAPNNTFPIGRWTTVAVTFTLEAETAGKISMGYVGPGGSGDMPHLFVDNVKILKNEKAEDCTSKVNKEGWTGASDGYQGGTINSARYYGYNKSGQIIYQTVSGLDNGTYEVAVYANSQQEWEGTITQPQSDISYVSVIGATETKEWINSYVRKAYPGDEKIGIYTISDVKVTDGTLTLSYNIDQQGKCGWHHFQIKSLIHTNGLSLADYEASVKELKDKIRAITALPPKYLENTNALLNAINDTYSTVSDYEGAISTLTGIYDNAITMEGLYAEYTNMHNYVTALLAVPYIENEAGAHDALETANDEPDMETDQDVYNAMWALNHAAWVYVGKADPDEGNQFDITFFLENPDVTQYWDGTWRIRPNGWLTDQTTDGQNFQVMSNPNMGPGGEVFMEYWSGSPAQNGFVLYQQVNLPSGTYKMTGRVAANFDNQGGTVQNVFFAANDAVGTQITSETLMDAEVEFVQDSEDIVKIGMIATSGNQARWMGINGIHLYKLPEKSYKIAEGEDYTWQEGGAGDVLLIRNLKPNTYNTMVLPFSMNADEIEQAFGYGTHVYLAERFVNNNISLRTPDYAVDGIGVEKIMPNVPFVILPTFVNSEYTPNGVSIPGRTLVPAETVNPQYNGENVTMLGNYAASYQVPQVGKVNWVIGYSNDDPTGATAADGTAYMPEAKLYYVNSDVTIGTTYCHFALEGADGAKAIGFDVEGEATGIAVVDNGDVKFFSGKAYDLSGREVKNPSKGLYIIGGKKVMIK